MVGKILIVDDEEAVRFFIADGLKRVGWQVYEADSGETALEMLVTLPCDVVLLDLRMGGVDGVTVMRQIKERWPQTMVIIMTAYATIDSAIEAVRQGAFDYLRKPCDVTDIIACVRQALLKKEQLASRPPTAVEGAEEVAPSAVIQSGPLAIDFGARTVILAGKLVSLTPTEFSLLEILARSPGQPIPLGQLITDGLAYDPDDPQAQETLRVHISRLRRKLSARYILTVRGGGYALANFSPQRASSSP
jgi:two-component system response regulator MprA